MQQLPNSRVVLGLVAALEVATLATFLYNMLPWLPDKMPEACLLVVCLILALVLHYRFAASQLQTLLWY